MQLKRSVYRRLVSGVLGIAVAVSLGASAVLAQESKVELPKLPQLMKDCGDSLKDFIDKDTGLLLEKARVSIDVAKPYSDNLHLNFRIAFEKARTQYHSFFDCVFNRVVEDMLSSSGADTKNLFSAHAPNLTQWMTPSNACLKEEKLVEALKAGSPANLVAPSLTVYNSYVEYLQSLLSSLVAVDRPQINVPFEEQAVRVDRLRRLSENEIQNALVALDTAFSSLKELRRAFTLHVHFQCMLQNLEVYRRSMQNLRSVVEMLPATLWDASMNK